MQNARRLSVESHKDKAQGRFWEWFWKKQEMDIFNLNLLILCLIFTFVASAQWMPGSGGRLLLGILSQIAYLPVLMILITKTLPSSAGSINGSPSMLCNSSGTHMWPAAFRKIWWKNMRIKPRQREKSSSTIFLLPFMR